VSGRFLLVSLIHVSLLACGSSSHEPTEDGAASEGGADAADPGAKIGEFDVRLVPPVSANGAMAATAGFTSVLGKVYASAVPEALIWELEQEDGGCRLLVPRVPFCDPACGGSAVCTENDVCTDNPATRNLGKVTVKGLKTMGGSAEFSIEPVQNTYLNPGDVKLPFPAFAEGDAIEVKTSGGDIAPFTLAGKGIAPFELSGNTSYELDADKPLALGWPAPGIADLSRIQVKLDISHHGGTKGKIECDVEDSGSLVIGSPMIGRLLALGVAGYPTVVVTRSAIAGTGTKGGRVDLKVYMYEERAVEVPGVISCTADEQCPSGRTCGKDARCTGS
jgi:hypothetical protein